MTAALQQVTTALGAVIAALQGQATLTAPAPAPLPAPTALPGAAPVTVAQPTTTGPAAGTDNVSGFTFIGDATERAHLNTALGEIASTSVGAGLLPLVRDRGVSLEIVTDAEFTQGGGSSTAAAHIRIDRTGQKPPIIQMRASLVGNADNPIRSSLAHELTHAAQHFAGEMQRGYAGIAPAAAQGLTADQLATGKVLMAESGAELVETAIAAQLKDPARFAQNARGKIDEAAKLNWDRVSSIPGYNPSNYQLPVVVSPMSIDLVNRALA